jgi:hypothetical protein
MSANVPEELAEAIILEQTGWTHQEYQQQPYKIIQALRVKMNTFARVENEAAKKKT